ncbi:MAG: ABC transporter permease [Chloroflexia bacterium]|nr:ABC transporter permease [Chloroflexia bacterium]
MTAGRTGAFLSGADQRLAKPARSQTRIVWDNFRRSKLAIVGGAVVLLLYLMAIFAPQLAPHPYEQLNPGAALQAPGSEYLLGTDRQTRDVLSRILVGSRVSLSVGFVAVAILMTIGVTIGALSGYFGGWIDNFFMRFVDIMLAIPQLLLLLLAVALFRPGLWTTMLVIGFTSWPPTARIVRSQFLSIKNQDFVLAARASGAGATRIMTRHLLPNALAIIIVQATLWLSFAILLESALSFLGLGVQPPEPTWGGMLADGRRNMREAYWLTTFPGVAIFVTVLAFNLLGDGLRDAFDPRMRRR